MSSAFCAACGAQLTPGARFCHRCGQGVGDPVYPPATPSTVAGRAPAAGPAAPPQNQVLPWAVAAIALLALIALLAGQRFNGRSSTEVAAAPDAGAAPTGAPDGAPPAAGPFAGGAGGAERPVRAPDISNMSPDERALRLFNRVVSLAEQGKMDSVRFFSPMALMAFQTLPKPTALQRFELGRIAELAELPDIVLAQSDTILRDAPDHLLGLTLARTGLGMKRMFNKQAAFDRRLLAAAKAERAKNLPEYEVTRVDLDSALARAKRNVQ